MADTKYLFTVTTVILVGTIAVSGQDGWGPWGDYSSCSRTCGGGVQSRGRRCLSSNNSKCQGQSIQYQSCSVQNCPPGSLDFRAHQCSQFNKVSVRSISKDKLFTWKPYFELSSPCALVCENNKGELVKLRDTVVDGTTCDDGHSFGVCVGGMCQTVGCDHVIDADTREDNCLVCGGKGDKCHTITGSTLDSTLQVDVETEIATLPIRATKLSIRLSTTTPVGLHLQGDGGKVFDLTNGLNLPGLSKVIEFAGSKGHLHVLQDGVKLNIRGPLNETLRLKIKPKSLDPLVEYQYSIPTSRLIEENPTERYAWVSGEWTKCSAECGPGYQLRAVNCMDRETGQPVNGTLCPQRDIQHRNRTCNYGPCNHENRYQWVAGHFGDCSSECGAGEETQSMHCLENVPAGGSKYVADDLCETHVGEKPVFKRACMGPGDSCPSWVPSEWSECSVTCGHGRQSRQVNCEQEGDEDDELPVILDHSKCPSQDRPLSIQSCTLEPCPDGSNNVMEAVVMEQDFVTKSSGCDQSLYGCCPDKTTPASGENNLGCTEQTTQDLCQLPKEKGLCSSKFSIKWYYNNQSGECDRFWYGGCSGNENPFETRDECRERCRQNVTKEQSCAFSTYGCCNDGVTYATGPNKAGCPRSHLIGGCKGTRYGCCSDGVTAARGTNNLGCNEEVRLIGGCAGTRYGCCADGLTAARGENKLGCLENPVLSCRSTLYGCCEDGITAATGPYQKGCPQSKNVVLGGCVSTQFGCCPDGVTAAKDANKENCPSFDQVHCGHIKDPGKCQNYAMSWYFDKQYGSCRQFWYGGCAGNQNRFPSRDDCESKCVQVEGPGACRLPVVAGVCRSTKKRFFHNYTSGECEEFDYGCNGNSNNFETIEECRSRCKKIITTSITKAPVQGCSSSPCLNGFDCLHLQNGSYICNCNPEWGKNCASPPDYWCLSHDECGQGLKCVRRRTCDSKGSCAVYARCSPSSIFVKCDKSSCGSNQDCVNDESYYGGFYCTEKSAYTRSTKVVLGCRVSEFGCCPNQQIPATGPNYLGCKQSCETTTYKCCRDGVTPADGPNYEGCEVEGSGEIPCEKTLFGCCEDGVTAATGPRGRGCGDTPDSEDRVPATTAQPVTKVETTGSQRIEKCKAIASTVKCTDYVVKWRFNDKKKECERHWWGGCPDNGNVFDTKEGCEALCKKGVLIAETVDLDFINICDMPSDPGPCKASMPRYYYNPRERKCIGFIFGGCQGNENNFATLTDCQRECLGAVTTPAPIPDTVTPQSSRNILTLTGQSSLQAGQDLKLTCSAIGKSQVKLEWFINGEPVSVMRNVGLKGRSAVASNGYQQVAELFISRAQVENSGTYYCRSSSGELEKIIISVRDSGAIVPSTTPTPTRTTSTPTRTTSTTTEVPRNVNSLITMRGESNVETGSTISITCRASGPRRPSEINWLINGYRVRQELGGPSISTYQDPRSRNALISDLTIRNAESKDEGTYVCRSVPYNDMHKMTVAVKEKTVIPDQPGTVTAPETPANDPAVVCRQEAVGGNCYASFNRWFYDHKEGSCKQFVYGGCGGNKNNFETQQQCNSFCSVQEICLKPKYVGRCRAALPRFYFDSQTRSCREFIYGGCEGNLNNFVSKTACERRCANPKPGFVGTEVVVIDAKQTTAQDVCKIDRDKGTCEDYQIKWYYSASRKHCARFVYTGCGGNGNRFDSEEDCKRRCGERQPITQTQPATGEPNIIPGSDTSACTQEKSAGNCDKWVIHWFFDSARGACNRFYYGGCGGNSNRFESKESCEKACIGATTSRPSIATTLPASCVYSAFGCCQDGLTRAVDRQKSNCYESNVIQPGTAGDHTLVYAQSGADTSIRCLLRGSEILWYRDRFLLSPSQRFKIFPNGTLLLKGVTEDMAGMYACRVYENNLPQLERYKVEISAPLTILPGPALMSFKPGSRAFLHCQAIGNPQPRLSWARIGNVLTNNNQHTIFGNGTLIINNVKLQDAGEYQCTAENGVSPTQKKKVMLNIKETVEVDIASHKGIFLEGEKIQLSCKGTGYPTPTLEWLRDGKVIQSDDSVKVQGGDLSILSATIENSGMYKCIARNNKSQAEDITTIQIHLQAPENNCKDTLSPIRCRGIVKARLCGIRTFSIPCCNSCRGWS
ncbi:unnamed protein product [Lymnaea stagnalis]|uniref:Papilin n=1 Tax=Lymnaea stagnalis TaxID=6523 RepID=A0AAV2HCV3_LYMST